MLEVTAAEAKAKLSSLLDAVEAGGAYQERSPLGVLRSAPQESYSES